MKLYRYISFEEFINLFVNEKELFKRPSSWYDKYEGYSFSLMETSEDVRKMIELMYYDSCIRNNYNDILDNMTNLWHAKWFAYAQCWSEVEDSDSMWRAYSYDKRAIRIRTTDEKIKQHLNSIDKNRYSIKFNKVEYDVNAETDILKLQIEQMKKNKNVYEPYFHKRKAFEYESEHRIVIVDNEDYSFENLSGSGIKFAIREEIESKSTDGEKIDFIRDIIMKFRTPWDRMNKNIADEMYFKNENLKDFIESVMIHPAAPKWYEDMVKEICGHSEIKCEGISDLYVRN